MNPSPAHPGPGHIELLADKIVYTSSATGTWRLDAASVRLIGEYVEESNGDRRIVLATADACLWFEFPLAADGASVLLQETGKRLNHDLAGAVGATASGRSRVLWPPALKEEPLFDFFAETPALTFFGRAKQSTASRRPPRFTAKVREFLSGTSAPGSGGT